MAYTKKTWQDRQTEYPARRKLTATGVTDVYDVTREEGLVTTVGDGFTAENMNDFEARVEAGFADTATKPTVTTATILASGWAGSAAPYTQSINVTGMASAIVPEIGPVYSATIATRYEQKAAWNLITKIDSAAGSITCTCDKEKPTVDIPIQIKVVK